MRIRHLGALLLLLCVALTPELAHAAPNFFEPVPGDAALEKLLKPLMGELVGGPSGGPLAAVMKVFNVACMTVGGLLALYTMIFGTMSTAHDGEVLGKRWSSAWVPLRTALGVALVAPTASGWCVAQMIVGWCAVQGIGLADTLWTTYATAFVQTSSLAPVTQMPSVQKLASSVLQSQICMAAYNAIGAKSPFPGRSDMTATATANGGRQYGGGGMSKDACGSVSYTLASNFSAAYATKNGANGVAGAGAQSIGMSLTGADLSDEATATIQKAHLAALGKLEGKLSGLANSMVTYRDKGGTPPSLAPLGAAISEYQADVAKAAQSAVGGKDVMSKVVESASKNGWLYAGAWFTKAAALQDAANRIVSAAPTARGINGSEFIAISATNDMAGYFSTSAALLSSLDNGLSDKNADDIQKAGNTNDPFQNFAATVSNKVAEGAQAVIQTGESRHPLMSIKDFGDYMMTAGTVGIVSGAALKASGAAVKAESDSLIGQAANIATLGATAAIAGGGSDIAATAGVLLISLSILILSFGSMLAVYLPLAPGLIFYGTALGWLLLCAEALIAAPLWAVAHLRPAGDDAPGQAGQGYMLLLGLFLRPALIVIGFIVGSLALQAVFTVLNDLFLPMFTMSMSGSITGVASIITMIGIYLGMALFSVHYAFGFIHKIPDMILRWIGGDREQLGESGHKAGGEGKAVGAAALVGITRQAQSYGRQHGAGQRGGDAPGSAKRPDAPGAADRAAMPEMAERARPGEKPEASTAAMDSLIVNHTDDQGRKIHDQDQ